MLVLVDCLVEGFAICYGMVPQPVTVLLLITVGIGYCHYHASALTGLSCEPTEYRYHGHFNREQHYDTTVKSLSKEGREIRVESVRQL